MKRDYRLYIDDILEAIGKIENYIINSHSTSLARITRLLMLWQRILRSSEKLQNTFLNQ